MFYFQLQNINIEITSNILILAPSAFLGREKNQKREWGLDIRNDGILHHGPHH